MNVWTVLPMAKSRSLNANHRTKVGLVELENVNHIQAPAIRGPWFFQFNIDMLIELHFVISGAGSLTTGQRPAIAGWWRCPKRDSKRNRKDPICFSPHLYRARNLIERFFNKIKQCRRVATRYDKLAANYLAFVKLASIRIWLRANESTP
jgi:hypothetical protein